MSKLSLEEVVYLANQSHIYLSDEEVDKMMLLLSDMISLIEKTKELEVNTKEEMISPSAVDCILFDETTKALDVNDILNNSNNVNGSYIEVRGVFDE